jgi:hypothetical protein
MRQLFKLLTFIAIILLFGTSCYYDSEESLYPSLNALCDTTNVTFSGQVLTTLANSCLSCHSNSTAAAFGNGIRLEDYADVKSKATSISGAINQTGSYSPMPKNGGKLNSCRIIQFDIWVRNGTPNN